MPVNLTGNWYPQYLPNIGNRQISDITFIDSLHGWAITPYTNQNDTTFLLKTVDGGNNWFIQFTGTGQFVGRNRIVFINPNTGFTIGNEHYSGSTKITKTTNGGNNWFSLNDPTTAVCNNLFVLNEDTIWLVSNNVTSGGVFRTTNGGADWHQQFSGNQQNPDRIYMYNSRIGFISNNTSSPNIYKTTNGGAVWEILVRGVGFYDIQFIDSLTGWRSSPAENTIYKTTNGGNSWNMQIIPSGGNILSSIGKLSILNRDTLWGVGGTVSFGSNGYRGIIYKTVNGGNNWLFQLPDTSIHIPGYAFIKFINNKTGWVYHSSLGGIQTNTGGDTVFYTGIQQVNNDIPKDFVLKQNYPNPFNPRTVISYSIKSSVYVKLIAYDITGQEVQVMVNNYQQPGEYEVDFMGKFTSSGVYFYRLTVDGMVVDVKKMVLLK